MWHTGLQTGWAENAPRSTTKAACLFISLASHEPPATPPRLRSTPTPRSQIPIATCHMGTWHMGTGHLAHGHLGTWRWIGHWQINSPARARVGCTRSACARVGCSLPLLNLAPPPIVARGRCSLLQCSTQRRACGARNCANGGPWAYI
jgi:hypothetical protein